MGSETVLSTSDLFGAIAGVLTSIRFLPQVYKTLTIKETRDLSLWFLIIVFFQAVFLILYGLTAPDNLIVAMNIMPLICAVVLLCCKVKYK